MPLFLISLKAGGTGLNLTAADTVIHYDPWWNPAVEDQATDRAHRIGQDKPVFVYKLVAQGTVEERMLELQQRKKALAAGIYEAGGNDAAAFDAADIERLFQPRDDRKAVFVGLYYYVSISQHDPYYTIPGPLSGRRESTTRPWSVRDRQVLRRQYGAAMRGPLLGF